MTSSLLAKTLTDFADQFGLVRPDTNSLEVRERAFEDACGAALARDDAGFEAAMARFHQEPTQ